MLDLEKSKKFMNLKFENFVDTLQGEDILAKTDRLDEVLSSGIMTGNEALGMVTMNKVSPESDIREKDGKIHNVIMLGSNSYLNLSTHPQVMDGARQALEEFGYGMVWELYLIMLVLLIYIKNWKAELQNFTGLKIQ